jgi:transcriptional regulator with XRE-family HTH domain
MDRHYYAKLSRNFRRFREHVGVTLEQIEAATGIKRDRLAKFENGRVRLNAVEMSASGCIILDAIRKSLGPTAPDDLKEQNRMLKILASMPEPKLPDFEEPGLAGFAAIDEALKPQRRTRSGKSKNRR